MQVLVILPFLWLTPVSSHLASSTQLQAETTACPVAHWLTWLVPWRCGDSTRGQYPAPSMANTELEQSRHSTCQTFELPASSLQKKMEIYRIFYLPKALYGWVSKFPPCWDSNLLFNSLSKMTSSNRVASQILRSVLCGGSSHLQALVATRLFKRLCRMKQRHTAFWSNAFGSPACALRHWRRDFGWTNAGQWKWTKEGESLQAPSHTEVDRQMHQMRMSWRLQLLRKFAGHSEHEAAEWRRSTTPIQMREEINQVNLEAARKSFHAADANGRAILLGSIVSPAYLGKAKGTDTSCPWCGSRGTFMRLAWHCKAFTDASQRPSISTSWLEKRLASAEHQHFPAQAGATMVGPRAAASAVGAPWLGTSP